MVLKVVVTCVVVLGVVVTPVITSEDPISQPRDWPCPDANDFYPCLCIYDELDHTLSIDCSLVETNEELAQAFENVVFPFTYLKEFKLEQDANPNVSLDTVGLNTFQDLTFERIIISGTKIEIIFEEDFYGSHETLTYLNLQNNKIKHFPFISVQLYPSLQTLILDDNQIPSLPEIQSDSLEILSINGNGGIQLDDFLGPPALQEIYLARNQIELLQVNFFWNLQNLTLVDLQRNEISILDEYTIASQSNALASINLDHNKISSIRHDAFHGLLPDAVVSMRNNTVVELDEDSWSHLFTQLVPTGTLDLADNPLNCGCDMDWIMFSPNQIDLRIFPDTTTCSSGNQIVDLDVQFFCDRCLPNNCSTLYPAGNVPQRT
ncbi:hypothetical protein CGJ15_24720 [Vibrio parahaemolyticus]|nr:oplophorus-luciferin 2-monooxygenase non-catalytic subunit-like [Cherax quadricarinatus]TOF89014.1 hypothetical protein CGJ15_24720 [Vibrio parahaemolyticus]